MERTEKELKELKAEVESLNSDLSEEELEEVSGGELGMPFPSCKSIDIAMG